MVLDDNKKNYLPVIAVFSVALLMAIFESFSVRRFMGFSLCILSLLKLMNIESFAEGFKRYDIISQSLPVYAQIFPFLELSIGLGFLWSGGLTFLVGLGAIAIGGIGAYSIYKAVYIENKDLNCACIGGNSKAPLGVVSMTENIIMIFMGLLLLT